LSAPVDDEHPVDQVVVQRFEIGVWHGPGEAGGVDQDVQSTEAPLDLDAQRFQCIRPRHVGGERGVAFSGQGLDHRCRGCGFFRNVAVAYCDAAAVFGEAPGGYRSDAAGSTDDEHNLAVHGLIHRLPHLIGGLGRIASPFSMTKR